MFKDYNTTRKKLVLPEYGRNVQIMVDHLLTIEDRELRNKAAQTVITVMGNLNPHLRDQSDFRHKLWDNLMIMADYQLDIDSPYEMPKKEVLEEKPNRILYPADEIRFRHYGKVVEMLAKEIMKVEDEQRRMEMLRNLANHMKKLYLTWNREQVNDDVIFNDLKEIIGQDVQFPPDMHLSETRELLAPKIRNKKRNNQRNKPR